MRSFTFKRESGWLLLLTVGPPALGMFVVLVWPTVAGWLGLR